MWKNNRVQWIEQGLVYRSSDRICISQMIWLMKATVYFTSIIIAFQISSKRWNCGITPNGVAFSYFTLVATISLFLHNSYVKSDWRKYWNTVGFYSFSNPIRHESVVKLTLFLFGTQLLSFIDYFNQLYAQTWSKWFCLRIRCWSSILAIIVVVYLLLVILQLDRLSILSDAVEHAPVKCLVGTLHALEDGGGIGNIMFELIGMLGIAQRLDRVPVILEPSLLERLDSISAYFPHIKKRFQRKEFCQHQVFISTPLEYCCRHDERIVDRLKIKSNAQSIAVRLRYLQSFKYFWNLRGVEVFQAVSGNERAVFLAKERLFPLNRLRQNQLNICVHVRRGDFAGSSMHLASDAEFTINAMHLLFKKARKEDSRTPHFYLFTDNVNWANRNIVEPYLARNYSDSMPLVAANFAGKPPNTEWEFSRLYCDRVLLTASTSTYGWWLAFLSRGQRVFYNREHMSPGAHAGEFSPEDFWPQHWIPLHAYRRNHVVEL